MQITLTGASAIRTGYRAGISAGREREQRCRDRIIGAVGRPSAEAQARNAARASESSSACATRPRSPPARQRRCVGIARGECGDTALVPHRHGEAGGAQRERLHQQAAAADNVEARLRDQAHQHPVGHARQAGPAIGKRLPARIDHQHRAPAPASAPAAASNGTGDMPSTT